jgi:hypothetical protein
VRQLLRKPFDILQFLDLVRGMLRAARTAETSAVVTAVANESAAAAAPLDPAPAVAASAARAQQAPGLLEAGQA